MFKIIKILRTFLTYLSYHFWIKIVIVITEFLSILVDPCMWSGLPESGSCLAELQHEGCQRIIEKLMRNRDGRCVILFFFCIQVLCMLKQHFPRSIVLVDLDFIKLLS